MCDNANDHNDGDDKDDDENFTKVYKKCLNYLRDIQKFTSETLIKSNQKTTKLTGWVRIHSN